jgi:hypothetical protein
MWENQGFVEGWLPETFSSTNLPGADQILDHFVESVVPIQMERIGSTTAGIFDALCVVVLKIADRATPRGLKCIPNMPTMAFPVGFPIGFPLTSWTFDLDC